MLCPAPLIPAADSTINAPSGFEPLGLYKSNENLNAALTAAEKAGLQVVNIGASDIINGRPASILGLSWQLIRVHLLSQINLKVCCHVGPNSRGLCGTPAAAPLVRKSTQQQSDPLALTELMTTFWRLP